MKVFKIGDVVELIDKQHEEDVLFKGAKLKIVNKDKGNSTDTFAGLKLENGDILDVKSHMHRQYLSRAMGFIVKLKDIKISCKLSRRKSI